MLTNQKKGELSIQDYLAAVKSCCDHLAMLDELVFESSHIFHILNGLTVEFEPIIAVINASPNQFDLDTVTIFLIDSEPRQKAFLQNTIAHANNMSHLPEDPTSGDNHMAFQA